MVFIKGASSHNEKQPEVMQISKLSEVCRALKKNESSLSGGIFLTWVCVVVAKTLLQVTSVVLQLCGTATMLCKHVNGTFM